MRLKLIAGNAIILLLVGLGSYWLVRSQLEQGLSSALEARVEGAAALFGRSWRADGARLTDDVSERAASSQVRQVFEAAGEDNRRRRAFDVAQSVSRWFQDPARGRDGPPHIVALVDETGRVIARDTDPNRMHRQSLLKSVPAVGSALKTGSPRYGVFLDQGKLVRVAVAPARSEDGGIVGALLVGYDLSNGFAKREAELLGQDVLFITSDAVYSTSTSVGVRDALQDALYDAPLETSTRAALVGKRSVPWRVSLRGDDYVGVTTPLPDVSGLEAGYVLLAHHGESTALSKVADGILWLTLLGLLATALYGFMVANGVMSRVERMEDGILAVINGQGDVRLEEESADLGGLSYRVNQLINLLMGVAEEDDEGRAVTTSGGWDAIRTTSPEITAAMGPAPHMEDPEVASLVNVPEAEYFTNLYREYVGAKTALGEDVSDLPEARFVERIRGNADHLLKKHGARLVRFKVETIGDQVNLKPIVIH